MTLIRKLLGISPATVFVFASSMLVFSILLWNGSRHLYNTAQHHQTLADKSAQGAGQEITLFLRDNHSRLSLFSIQEGVSLARLAETPSDQSMLKSFWLRIQLQFPDAEAYGLTNNNGDLLLTQNTQQSSEHLRHNLRLFTQGKSPPLQIRQRDESYIYRILVPWYQGGLRRGILFMDFACGALCRSLQNHQPPGHKLTLRPLNAPESINKSGLTITSSWLGLKPIVAEAVVSNLPWQVCDDAGADILLRKLIEITIESIVLFGCFLAASLVLYSRYRRKESALIQSERRYLNLLETSEDLIWTVDRHGVITGINDKTTDILGVEPVDMIGRRFVEWSVMEEQEKDLEVFKQMVDGKSCQHHLTRLRHADGNEVYLNINAIPLRNASGHISGATGTATNVTGQMLSLKELQSKERRYRQMFERNRAVKLVLDAHHGDIVEANSAAVHYYGYPQHKLQTMNIGDISVADENILANRLKLARESKQYCFSVQHQLASGEIRDVEIQAGPLDSNGHPLLYLIIQDVTERNQSVARLQENDEKLQAIVDASIEGILMTDSEGAIKLFNPAAQMMFGYLPEEIIGRRLSLLIPPSTRSSQPNFLGSLLHSAQTMGVGSGRELPGLHKNGREFLMRMSLSQVELDGKTHYVGMMQDITEFRQKEQRLDYLARNDVLTGLLNRAEFERRLNVTLSLAEIPDAHHTLCYIDLDQFKLINDTCGYVAGDELLKQTAMLLRAQLRDFEIVSRLGGDEFGALLTDCSIERAVKIGNGLLQTIRNFLFTWQDQSFEIGVSIGLAGFNPHSDSVSSILSAADLACQMAKQQGRNRLHIYQHTDEELVRHHGDMHLVSRINQALNEERFHLLAQPIVPVGKNKVASQHYEILVRMVDEAGELVIPDDFIPAAERYILMPAIDRWVISQLFAQQGENLRQWAQQNGAQDGFLFAINLSGTSLSDDGFLTYLQRQFTAWNIPFRSICFEITETAAVANLGKAKRLIEKLKTLGCCFALDDFGTGMSSYKYLKELPVDYLKIDGSFVRHMTEDPVDYAMVESINQIGHILGLQTIAEWVEDQATLNQLNAINVDFAQGYGVGTLQPVETFTLTPGKYGKEIQISP